MHPSSIEEGELVHYYYKSIFPVGLIMRLFGGRTDNYGNIVDIDNREVALRLGEGTGGNPRSFMSRYYSFSNTSRFTYVLINQLPTCIFIGAGYSYTPSRYKTMRSRSAKCPPPPLTACPFLAMHHEFVLDLDLSDYDRLRSCCQSRKICSKCWRFMAVACEMIDHVLQEDFGMKHRLWLFSGGRGIHCWGFDRCNLTMDKTQRDSILEYIEEMLSPEMSKLERHLCNPTAVQLYQTALKYVPNILKEQNCFDNMHSQNFLMGYINKHLTDENSKDKSLREQIIALLKSRTSESTADFQTSNISVQLYALLQQHSLTSANAAMVLRRTVKYVVQPRIDAPVTRDITHLLRCPLSVHMRAGCGLVVPFRVADVAQFLDSHVHLLPRIRFEDYMLNVQPSLLNQDLGVEDGRYAEWKRIIEEMCEALEQDELNTAAEKLKGVIDDEGKNGTNTLSETPENGEAVLIQRIDKEVTQKIEGKGLNFEVFVNILIDSKDYIQEEEKLLENNNEQIANSNKVTEGSKNNEDANVLEPNVEINEIKEAEQQIENNAESKEVCINTQEARSETVLATVAIVSNNVIEKEKICEEHVEASTNVQSVREATEIIDVDVYSKQQFDQMMRIFDDSDGDLVSDTDSDVVFVGEELGEKSSVC